MTQAVATLRSIARADIASAPAIGWRDDLRFFLRCYLWGVAFFLAFLS